MRFVLAMGFAAAMAAMSTSAQAATVTFGPGGFDGGFATSITYESDNAVAGRGTGNGRFRPQNALGAADGAFFEIGLGSSVDLTFGTLFDTSATIIEVTFNNPSAQIELVSVFGGRNGVFSFLGTVSNVDAQGVGATLIFPTADIFDTLRLVDLTRSSERVGGFDIDSVRVNPVAPIPLPAAGLMLLTGLAAFAATRRRRKA